MAKGLQSWLDERPVADQLDKSGDANILANSRVVAIETIFESGNERGNYSIHQMQTAPRLRGYAFIIMG
jgi:hypothetical protein